MLFLFYVGDKGFQRLMGWQAGVRARPPNFKPQASDTALPGALLCGDCAEERALLQDARMCSTFEHPGNMGCVVSGLWEAVSSDPREHCDLLG